MTGHYPPFSRLDFEARRERAVAPATEALPWIDDLADELPLIDDFLADPDAEPSPEPELPSTGTAPQDEDIDGWAVAEWQRYDWTSVASLGVPAGEHADADASWRETEWANANDPPPRSEATVSSAAPTADEVAEALDGIARRIRSGELVIDELHGAPPEAAMAAALATVLRMRR
ncbi:MAG: hypothetical protein ABI681_11375 [Gemmatimonadales bacterium]